MKGSQGGRTTVAAEREQKAQLSLHTGSGGSEISQPAAYGYSVRELTLESRPPHPSQALSTGGPRERKEREVGKGICMWLGFLSEKKPSSSLFFGKPGWKHKSRTAPQMCCGLGVGR